MDCIQFQNLIYRAIDHKQGLDEKEKRSLDEHTSACKQCKEQLAELMEIEEILGSIKKVEPPVKLKEMVVNAAIKEGLIIDTPKYRISTVSKFCAVAASFLLLFMLNEVFMISPFTGEDQSNDQLYMTENESTNIGVRNIKDVEEELFKDNLEGEEDGTLTNSYSGGQIDENKNNNKRNVGLLLASGVLVIPLGIDLYNRRKVK